MINLNTHIKSSCFSSEDYCLMLKQKGFIRSVICYLVTFPETRRSYSFEHIKFHALIIVVKVAAILFF